MELKSANAVKNQKRKSGGDGGLKRASDLCAPRFRVPECRFHIAIDFETLGNDISAASLERILKNTNCLAECVRIVLAVARTKDRCLLAIQGYFVQRRVELDEIVLQFTVALYGAAEYDRIIPGELFRARICHILQCYLRTRLLETCCHNGGRSSVFPVVEPYIKIVFAIVNPLSTFACFENRLVNLHGNYVNK